MGLGRFYIHVYGRWGSEPYGFAKTLDEAKEKAKRASEKDPENEYSVEWGEPGGDAITYKAGRQLGGDKGGRRRAKGKRRGGWSSSSTWSKSKKRSVSKAFKRGGARSVRFLGESKRVGSGYEAFKLFQQKNGKGFLLHKASRTKNGWAILVSTTKNRNARRAYEVSRSGKITFGVKKWPSQTTAKKARNRKNARSFGKLAKGQGWKWDRKIQAYRRVSRDMSSELRGYSLQALGRMLRRAINQGDEHKARLIEQEIDRRSRR